MLNPRTIPTPKILIGILEILTLGFGFVLWEIQINTKEPTAVNKLTRGHEVKIKCMIYLKQKLKPFNKDCM